MRCEGYRKYGSFMTLGPRVWRQCENEAIALLEIEQDGKVETLPGCDVCWQEAIDRGIKILSVRPIAKAEDGDGGA